MKLLCLIFRVIVNTYFSSADPNLFGSVKRRQGKQNIANEFKAMATGTQEEIDKVKAENPFESAGARAAMANASRGANAMQTKMFNSMGVGATPEAIIAAQGSATEALGSAAGQIAAGAEANAANKISNLQGQKTQQMGMYGQQSNSAESERGSGWNTLFQGVEALGAGAKGAGGLITSLSDIRLKENIYKIGEIQGCNIYKFNFKGDPRTVIGVIAQELENTEHSDCISPVGEYLSVDYDKLFKEV